MADITKTHSTEIYKDEQLISVLCFLVMFMLLIYIFLCYVLWWCPCCSSLYISVLCFLVMSMLLIFIYFCVMFFGDVHVLIFIYFCAMFFGDVHVGHLYIFLCYVFWWCPCCSPLYISVLCFLVMSMLLIFIYFCVMFFGDVHVALLYIFWTSPKT
jgi:hypothetical protein